MFLKICFFIFGFLVSTENIFSNLIFFQGYRYVCIFSLALVSFIILFKKLFFGEKEKRVNWTGLSFNLVFIILILGSTIYHNQDFPKNYFFYILLFLPLFYVINIKNYYPGLICGLFFGNTLLILLGVTGYYSRFSPLLSEYHQGSNVFAYLQAIFIIMGLLFLSDDNYKKHFFAKTLLTAGIAASIFALLRTGSRGAIFGVLIGLIYALIKYRNKILPMLKIACLVLFLGSIVFLCFLNLPENKATSDLFLQRLSWEYAVESGGSGRTEIFRQLIKNYPEDIILFGFGPFGKHKITELNSLRSETHNIFLQALYEFGLITFATFLIFIFNIFYSIQKNPSNKYDVLLITVLVSAFFLHVFIHTETILAFAVINNAYKFYSCK